MMEISNGEDEVVYVFYLVLENKNQELILEANTGDFLNKNFNMVGIYILSLWAHKHFPEP